MKKPAACSWSIAGKNPPGATFVSRYRHLDDIEVDGHRLVHVDYGINPPGDRLYINMLQIDPTHQRQGLGLGVLWNLWRTHEVQIVPLYQYTSSEGSGTGRADSLQRPAP